MSFTYNSAEVQGVTYNGDDVQSVTMDGVEVWSAHPQPKANLKDNTPEEIQYAAQHDLAASLWDIGDWFEMTLNGNWQCVDNTITLNNYVIRCVLIGINHNADKEGNHLLHFQMGKNTDNVDVAFYYSKMGTSHTSSGGWASCGMRTITMANLYNNIIPSNWRSVIKACTKYTDNTGGSSNNASYVTATSDNCFMLAEYEVFEKRYFANSAEQNYQKRYAYYANGNSNLHYRHDSPTSTTHWFLRSCDKAHGNDFLNVAVGQSYPGWTEANTYTSRYGTNSFSPAFCIG